MSKFKYDVTNISIAPPLAQWSWLILNAQTYSADELRRLFPDLAFQNAIRCLETISSRTEDKAMHDPRSKAQRDYDWMLATAREQGLEEGIELGIEKGIEKGREQGNVIGAIQSLQQILSDTVSSTQDLSQQSISELQTQLAELQTRVRARLK